jgi:IMP dehydrogenase
MAIHQSELESLSYDDILLVPQHSYINSRDDVNLILKNGKLPVFSAPMKNVSTADFCIELGRLGGVPILHRFFENFQDHLESIKKVSKSGYSFGIAIGINNFEKELRCVFADGCKYVCLDTADGYLQKVIDATNNLRKFRDKNNLDFDIIAGNVAESSGALSLASAGADFIRVGIGNGSACSTRNVTAVGMPDLTAILSCTFIKTSYPNLKLIADGGIKNSGNAVKALAFGADAVMLGGVFARAKETNCNGNYYGMASFKLQTEANKLLKSNEGLTFSFPPEEIRPLSEIMQEFLYGIKSGLSYLGIDDINEIHKSYIEYIKVGRGVIKDL